MNRLGRFLLSMLAIGFIALDESQCLLFRNVMLQTRKKSLKAFKDFSPPSTNQEPLILTKYIQSGELEMGKNLSRVTLPGQRIESYAGFFTVNSTYNSNMFFWFFPAMSVPAYQTSSSGFQKLDDPQAPLLVWLQGGPGGSSLFGLFVENGPFKVNKSGDLEPNPFSWNYNFNVLYIDNPVGAGYSFTGSKQGFSQNQVDVSENLYSMMKQFFVIFPEFHSRPLFLSGESYAGKYIPAFGYKIHTMAEQARLDGFNLQGMAIGNGYTDPRDMCDYGNFLYQIGLIDGKQRDHFLTLQQTLIEMIELGRLREATDFNDRYLSEAIQEIGYNYMYNFLLDQEPEDFDYYLKYLANDSIRVAIHVGDLPYHPLSGIVFRRMHSDMMASVKPLVEKLLDANYRMMFYSGQLDIIVASPLTANFLRKLRWHGTKQYYQAPRIIYRLKSKPTEIAGYVRQVDNLYQVIIRNAGHILPYDQPEVAYDMITRFVRNVTFE